MAQGESENHEGSAFSRVGPASSQNGFRGMSSQMTFRDRVAVAWALGLVLWILLHASLLTDATLFTGIAALFDHPAPAWIEAVLGFTCLIVVSDHLSGRSAARPQTAATLVLSVSAIAGYVYHLFLLRWPWLAGTADARCRLSLWSARLSTTWHGAPLLAFGELMSILLLLVHAGVGLSATANRSVFVARVRGARVAVVTIGMTAYLLASAVVVALATGRR
jgi:hypothetical protein